MILQNELRTIMKKKVERIGKVKSQNFIGLIGYVGMGRDCLCNDAVDLMRV